MSPKKAKYILDYFDTSILIPYYGQITALKKYFLVNESNFRQNGIEIVLLTDKNCNEAMSLPEEFPFINWKIVFAPVSVTKDISILLNYSLLQATNKYVLGIYPGMTFLSEAVYELRYHLRHYPNHFAIVLNSENICVRENNFGTQFLLQDDYSMIMVERDGLLAVGGFVTTTSPSLSKYTLLRKLELSGLKKLVFPVNYTQEISLPTSTENTSNNFNVDNLTSMLRENMYPKKLPHSIQLFNQKELPYFDWRYNKSKQAFENVLHKFEKYSFFDQDIMKSEYIIICLLQVRNEITQISDVLLHLEEHCDGVILLDDGSTDGTYDAAQSSKLLIKAKKANEGIFNDLENRNLLLQLGYLFRAEWYFFLDADERFDARCADLKNITSVSDIDTVSFRRVHIWGKTDCYRKDLPEGEKGVMNRYRMFRNKGFLQVVSDREIHFCPTPFIQKQYHSSILLLHFGLYDEATRKRKMDTYLLQDPVGNKQGFRYDFLLDKEVQLGKVDDLVGYKKTLLKSI